MIGDYEMAIKFLTGRQVPLDGLTDPSNIPALGMDAVLLYFMFKKTTPIWIKVLLGLNVAGDLKSVFSENKDCNCNK